MPVQLNVTDAGRWADWVSQFDAARANVQNVQNALSSFRGLAQTLPAAELARYNDLVARGASNINALNALGEQRNNVLRWVETVRTSPSATIGLANPILGAITGAADFIGSLFNPPKQTLGYLPLIIVGVSLVAASAVVITAMNWAREAQAMTTRLNELRRLQASGLTPEQAAATVNQTLGPPQNPGDFLSSALNLGPALALGAGAIVLLMVARR